MTTLNQAQQRHAVRIPGENLQLNIAQQRTLIAELKARHITDARTAAEVARQMFCTND